MPWPIWARSQVEGEVCRALRRRCPDRQRLPGHRRHLPRSPSFASKKDAGIFVLVKTSNPSSGELQDREHRRARPVYSRHGRACARSGAMSCMGELRLLGSGRCGGCHLSRAAGRTAQEPCRTPSSWCPATEPRAAAADDVIGAFDEKGLGAIINSSRAVLTAWKKQNRPRRVNMPLPPGTRPSACGTTSPSIFPKSRL